MGPAVTQTLILPTISRAVHNPRSERGRKRKYTSQLQPASQRARPHENTAFLRVEISNKLFLSQLIDPQKASKTFEGSQTRSMVDAKIEMI